MVLMRDLWNFTFFGQGDVSPTHSELCRFVLGVIGKTPGLISHNNFVKKIFCLHQPSRCLARCNLIFPLLRRREAWNKMSTQPSLSQILFQNQRTTVLGMFKDSAIILDAIRWSFLTNSATAGMFTLVRVNFGCPPPSSSSTGSLPSQNREQHLKTFNWFTASFP
jgi:hypothetical protein